MGRCRPAETTPKGTKGQPKWCQHKLSVKSYIYIYFFLPKWSVEEGPFYSSRMRMFLSTLLPEVNQYSHPCGVADLRSCLRGQLISSFVMLQGHHKWLDRRPMPRTSNNAGPSLGKWMGGAWRRGGSGIRISHSNEPLVCWLSHPFCSGCRRTVLSHGKAERICGKLINPQQIITELSNYSKVSKKTKKQNNATLQKGSTFWLSQLTNARTSPLSHLLLPLVHFSGHIQQHTSYLMQPNATVTLVTEG